MLLALPIFLLLSSRLSMTNSMFLLVSLPPFIHIISWWYAQESPSCSCFCYEHFSNINWCCYRSPTYQTRAYKRMHEWLFISLVDVSINTRDEITKEQFNETLKTATESGHLKWIMKYSEDKIVSSDVIENPYSSIADGHQ